MKNYEALKLKKVIEIKENSLKIHIKEMDALRNKIRYSNLKILLLIDKYNIKITTINELIVKSNGEDVTGLLAVRRFLSEFIVDLNEFDIVNPK